MKLSLLLLISLSLSFVSFSQESKSKNVYPETPLPSKESTTSIQDVIAELTQSVQGTSYTYSFVSNRTLSFERAESWETRFHEAFPVLEEIHIDASTQSVSIRIPQSHSNQDLLEMVTKFGYTNFEINQ